MVASYARDNLRHDKISPGVFLGMMRTMQDVSTRSCGHFRPRQHSSSPATTGWSAPAASREFFAKLTNKKNQIHVYPDSLHEIYKRTLDKETVIADLKKFLGGFKKASA